MLPGKKHWIVIEAEKGPAGMPYAHGERRAGVDEAGRLAGLHPGKSFLVYECIGKASKVDVVYEGFSDSDEPPF